MHVWWRAQSEVLACVRAVVGDENTLLTPGDVESLSRTSHAQAQEARRCARLLLRALVARLFGTEAARVELQEAAHGKPAFHSPDPQLLLPEFSLSHSGDTVAVALSLAGPVGVDVEAAALDATRAERLASRTLDTHTLSEWNALAPSQRVAAFLSQWTQREALLKATGEGLTRDPRSLVVPLTLGCGTAHDVRVDASGGVRDREASPPAGDQESSTWRVHVLHTNPHVALAASPGALVRVF